MKPIVITGCQRSGTAYIAAVITASGHYCSHERMFRDGRYQDLYPHTIESSWAAPAYLKDRLTDEPDVIHQVRHPLKVVSSLLSRGTFKGNQRHSARWAVEVHPAIQHEGDSELIRCLRYWVEWNLLVESLRPSERWRIEDLSPSLLASVLTERERWVPADRVGLAMEMMPVVNRSAHSPGTLDWENIPDCKLKRRAMTMADRYGYPL